MFGTPTTFSKSKVHNTQGSANDSNTHFSNSHFGPARHPIEVKGKLWRKLVFALLAISSSLLGVWVMVEILRPNGMTPLEYALLGLFTVTFAWIASSFCSALIGFLLQLFKLDPLTLSRHTATPQPASVAGSRTAVVMPVYNEDTHRVMAGFEANVRSLLATGEGQHFDFYLLSDTQDPKIAAAEADAWQRFRHHIGQYGNQCFYRRREKNTHRKVGNLMDFCTRWGSHYQQMIVLDADSIMTGDCMMSLVHTMTENPQTGLIQTVPIPVRSTTFFGRFVQFASTLYSPMLATGLAFWQTDSANYWGHNAIIRIDAFIEHCGLPSLKGNKGPFSGEILSHDFVEAALMRRAGWEVWLLADLPGSYEEVPSNILDYATRDRRWVEGNIQHLALLSSRGIRGMNKLHFLFGAVAYMSSLFWLLMLALSTVDAVLRSLNANVFFQSSHQLFPDWPIAKTGLIITLLYVTAAMLLLPKVLALVIALRDRRKTFGGAGKLLRGTLVESLFAILVAPLMMVFHAYFVLSVFAGHKVSWNAQPREGRMLGWGESLARTALSSVVISAWGGAVYYYAPTFFWWMMPVVVGLVLAAPIVRYSSSIGLGQHMRRWGIFLTPSEVQQQPILQDLADLERPSLSTDNTGHATTYTSTSMRKEHGESYFQMPMELPTEMPIQSFAAMPVQRQWVTQT